MGTTLASAADILWVSTVDGDWNNPDNWWPAQVPGAGDYAHIILDGAFYVNLNGNVTVDSWELGADLGSQGLRINGYSLNATTVGTVHELGNVLLNGGSFGGTGDLHWYGALTWENGSFNGSGALNFYSGSDVSITTNANRYLDYRTLTNSTLVDWTGGGTLIMRYGSVINNNAFWNFGSSASVYHNAGASVAFNNYGVLNLPTGSGTISISGGSGLTFTQASSGQIDMDAGSVQLDCNASIEGSCLLATSTELRLTSSSQTLDGTIVQGDGTLKANGGTVTIHNTVTVDNLLQTTGTIQGNGTLMIMEDFTWSSGYQSGTGTTQIPGSVQMTMNGSNKYLSGRTIENHGTISFTAGTLLFGNAATINNNSSAVFEIANGLWMYHWSGAYSTFNNEGTFRKTTGSGTSYVQTLPFINSNLIEVVEGTLSMDYNVTHSDGTVDCSPGAVYQLPSGNVYTNSGSHFTGVGTTLVSGATVTVSDTLFADHLLQTSGTMTGDGVILINDDFGWSGGYQSGDGETLILNPAQLTMNGGNKYLSSRAIENLGNINFSAGTLLFGNAAIINNRNGAVFEIANDLWMYHWSGAYSSFNNEGTYRKTAGGGTSYVQSLPFSNTNLIEVVEGTLSMDYSVTHSGGTVDCSPGAVYQLPSGNVYTNSGSQFIGEGTALVSGATVTVSDNLYVNHLQQTSGRISGDGVLWINNDYIWSGGYQQDTGSTVIPVGSYLAMNGTTKYLSARTIENHGTCSLLAAGLLFGNAATFNNNSGSVFEIEDGLQMYHWSGDYSIFNNEGTFRKPAGTGVSYVQSVPFVNSSQIEVLEGTLSMDYSVTHSDGTVDCSPGAVYQLPSGNVYTNSGSHFTGVGTTLVSGATVTVSDTLFADHLLQTSGTMTGNGVIYVNDDFTWSGGYQSGSGSTVIPGGSLMTMNGTNKLLRTRTIDNYGYAALTAGDLLLGDAATINNKPGSLYEISDGLYMYYWTGDLSTFNNEGTFSKPSGAAVSHLQSLYFYNEGLLSVESGTVSIASSHFENMVSGTISGTGTFNVQGAASYVNNGIFSPGLSPGVLTFNLNYTSTASSILDLEFAGLSVGTEYDRLAVNGTAGLNGGITVSMLDEYLPGVNDEFPVLTHSGYSGAFDTPDNRDQRFIILLCRLPGHRSGFDHPPVYYSCTGH